MVRNAGAYPEVIDNELRQYLPFLATTKLLVHAVRHGMGREDAHEVIKEHAVATALSMRQGEGDGSRLIDRLAVDERFPGSKSELWAMIGKPAELLGTVEKQVGVFCDQVETLSSEYAEPWYRGAEIL